MLRSLLIAMSKSTWLKKVVTHWGPARKASRRFIAGETLGQAIEAASRLNKAGINATLDQLGENTTSTEGAQKAAQEVLAILDAISENHVRSNVSVKLSQIGLCLDAALCAENLSMILDHAAAKGLFIRIDMEGSNLTQSTLDQYHRMIEAGYKNVGIVIQAYLYRSHADIRELSSWGGKVRLCKGAYKEPASIAFPRLEDVNTNFDQLTRMLFVSALNSRSPLVSKDGHVPPIPALATHDPKRIEFARQLVEEMGLPHQAVEFQMLYGIRRDLQEEMVKAGFPVRVYVPFGTQWYPYFMRRLAERPANLLFFISSFFRK
jgi:proline dehydrogenase